MAEPTSPTAGIAAAAIALLGPLAGDWAIIVFASLAGSLWPLTAQQHSSRTASALFVLRLVLTSASLTGTAAWWIETNWHLPARHMLAPVAFAIAAVGEGWRAVFQAVVRWAVVRIGGPTGGPQS